MPFLSVSGSDSPGEFIIFLFKIPQSVLLSIVYNFIKLTRTDVNLR